MSPSETRSGIIPLLRQHGLTPVIDNAVEESGADYIVEVAIGLLAVQRKTVNDLLSSVGSSDRLSRELAALRHTDIPWLVVEGDIGEVVEKYAHWNIGSIRKLLTSIRREGIWVQHTSCVGDTAMWLAEQTEYWNSPRHDSLLTRPRPPASVRAANQEREQRLYILMGLPGIGRHRAEAIYNYFGRLPFVWSCTAEELSNVDGIGQIIAEKLLGMFVADGKIEIARTMAGKLEKQEAKPKFGRISDGLA